MVFFVVWIQRKYKLLLTKNSLGGIVIYNIEQHGGMMNNLRVSNPREVAEVVSVKHTY